MNFSEFHLEDAIFKELSAGNIFKLNQRGLSSVFPNYTFVRQMDLGKYGRADIIGFHYKRDHWQYMEKILEIHIIEIKKGEINFDTLKQAIRYAKGIEELCSPYQTFSLSFRFTLIGSAICLTDFIYLADFMYNLSIFTTELTIDGIYFKKEQGYSANGDDILANDFHKSLFRKIVNDYVIKFEPEPREIPF